jgi:hypothetical protein
LLLLLAGNGLPFVEAGGRDEARLRRKAWRKAGLSATVSERAFIMRLPMADPDAPATDATICLAEPTS